MNGFSSRGIAERIPPVVPHHRLLRRIGAGSYGEVWLALDAMGKWCAVKVVRWDETDDGRACDREFKGLKRYDDLAGGEAHLMPIRDVGRDAEWAYFYYAMELADDIATRRPLPRPENAEALSRETLAMVERYRPWTLTEQLRREGRLPYQDCIEYGMVLSSALDVLHQGRLVHRDVKPSNIVFVNGRPRLADIGLVTTIDATLISMAGTSGFVPLHGAGSPSGDLFALGKVLYLMATGKAVHEFPAEAADLGQLGTEERHALAELRAVYDRACEVMPAERYASAKALRDDLELLRRNESVIQLRELQEQEGRLLEEARKQRRQVRVLASGIVALVVLSAVAWWLVGLNRRIARQAVLAELEVRQLLRMQGRNEGWALEDWRRAQRAAALRLEDEDVWRHAAATLSGLDAHQVAYWRNVEATSAAFGDDNRIVLAGHGTNQSMMVSGLTDRVSLPVQGEGKVCWTATGEAWVLQAEEHACVVRDALTGAIVQSLPLQLGEKVTVVAGPVMAISLDGKLVAASLTTPGDRSRMVVWQVTEGRELGEIPMPATALAFSPDGARLAVGDAAGTTRVFSTVPLALATTLGPGSPPNPITALAFGRSARLPREESAEVPGWVLAAGDSGVRITVWDLADRIPLAYCYGSTWSIQSLAFHPNGQTLASAGRNGVLLWDATSGRELLELHKACGGDTRALAFDRSGTLLVGGSTAQHQYAEVSIWRLESNRGIRQLRGLTTCVRKVVYSPDGTSIAALSDEWQVGVWDCGSERLRALIEVPPGILADNAALAFNPEGDRLAYAAGHLARVYDLNNRRMTEAWSLDRGRGDQLRFEPDGSLTLMRMERRLGVDRWTIYKLEAATAPQLKRVQPGVDYRMDSVYLPARGPRFFGLGRLEPAAQNIVLGFALETGDEVWRQALAQTNNWLRLILDADGRRLATEAATPDLTYQVFQATDGRIVHRPRAPWLAIGSRSDVHASPDADYKLLFIGSRDGREVVPISIDGKWSKDTLTFSPDERHLAAGNNDGTVLVADLEAVRQRLRALSVDPAKLIRPEPAAFGAVGEALSIP